MEPGLAFGAITSTGKFLSPDQLDALPVDSAYSELSAAQPSSVSPSSITLPPEPDTHSGKSERAALVQGAVSAFFRHYHRSDHPRSHVEPAPVQGVLSHHLDSYGLRVNSPPEIVPCGSAATVQVATRVLLPVTPTHQSVISPASPQDAETSAPRAAPSTQMVSPVQGEVEAQSVSPEACFEDLMRVFLTLAKNSSPPLASSVMRMRDSMYVSQKPTPPSALPLSGGASQSTEFSLSGGASTAPISPPSFSACTPDSSIFPAHHSSCGRISR